MANRKAKIRILMLSWEYPPHVVGGLGAHVAALVPALARAGVEVHLVTPRWAGGRLHETIRVSPRQKKSAAAFIHRVSPALPLTNDFFVDAQQTNAALEKQAESLYKKFGGFDLIHAHDWLVAFAAVNLKRLHKTPLLATIHATERGRGRGQLGSETSRAINNTEWWLTYEAWRVICTSQFMTDEVKNYFQVPLDKVDVIPNGVNTKPFDVLKKKELGELRAKWANADEHIVFMVGRLMHEKGAHLLLEAAPRVLAEIPNTKFLVAGTGMMTDYLKKRAGDLGIADKFILTGFISDEERNKLLRVSDAAVFPSLYEPFGIVALEAMAAKCPVIVSEIGGFKEVVRHAETGITVYPDSAESLAWGILHTLHRPDWARTRAANAYRMVKREYNWDRIAKRTAEVYKRIVRERARAVW